MPIISAVIHSWSVQITGLRSSERMQSSTAGQSRSLVSENAAVPCLHVTTVVNTFCLPVKLSPCRSRFVASPNLATFQPRRGVFACLLIAPEGLGNESHWKWWARGSGFFHENFSQFHPRLPPEKPEFLFCLAYPPPPGGSPFEHSGTKMGTPWDTLYTV